MRLATFFLCLLLCAAQARELTATERRQVAEQVQSWDNPAFQLRLQAAAELGDVQGVLDGLRKLPETSEVRATSGITLLPAFARRGDIKAAQEILRRIGPGRLQGWFWGAYLFTREQGLDRGLKFLEGLPSFKERIITEATLGQAVPAEPKLHPFADSLGEKIWQDYQKLPVAEQKQLYLISARVPSGHQRGHDPADVPSP